MSPILILGLIIALAIVVGVILIVKARKTIAKTLPEPEFKARPTVYDSKDPESPTYRQTT